MEITQIKVDKHIAYERPLDSGGKEFCQVPWDGEAHPDLYIALNSLVKFAAEECHLGDEWLEAQVIGLSLKTTDSGEGLTLTLSLPREGQSPLLINLPFTMTEFLPGREAASVYQACKEAELYIHGKRAQGSLPLDVVLPESTQDELEACTEDFCPAPKRRAKAK